MASRFRLRGVTNNLVAMCTVVIVLAPIYLVVVNALKTRVESSSMGLGLPAVPQWQNFGVAISEGKLLGAFLNSVLYSVGATVLSVGLSALAAFVLARRTTRRHRLIYLLLIMGIAMPTNFVTLTRVMQWTHLINTQLGIILLYAATQIPFSIFLIYAFIQRIPRELDEAAVIDGCGPLRVFGYIITPMLVPVLVTLGVLSILNIWNEFLLPLYYLNNSGAWPMTLAVYNFYGQFHADWSLVSADVVLTILPVAVLYLASQRWILSGTTAGAVKG